MADVQTKDLDELRIDVEKLTEENLDELALLVVRRLRDSMRQELDRSGRS